MSADPISDPANCPSRLRWFMLGFYANSCWSIFLGGEEKAAANLEAWAGLGWLGFSVWFVSPIAFLVIVAVLMISKFRERFA